MLKLLGVTACSSLSVVAGAQTYTYPYSCTQQVTMRPPAQSRWDYVAAKQFTHCHHWYLGVQQGYTVNPSPQNPGFHTHGIDQRWNNGWYSFCVQPCAQVAVPLNMRTTYVDYPGTGVNGLQLRSSMPSLARAEAFSRVDVAAWGHGQPVTATVHASGFRQAMQFGYWSRSFALSEVEAKYWIPGPPLSGPSTLLVSWSPRAASVLSHVHRIGFPGWAPPTPQSQVFRLYDPIVVSVTGPNGVIETQTLLDMYIDLHDAGEITLEEGVVHWDASDADYVLRWGAFGSAAGEMRLSCRGGVVVSAQSDADLAELPPEGTPIPFSFRVPTLDLEMALHHVAGYPYEATIGTSDGSSAPLWETIRCAADWNLDGFIDGFDYDEFVMCFESEADCGWHGAADFNTDGFVDGFDYDEFVQAFELGC